MHYNLMNFVGKASCVCGMGCRRDFTFSSRHQCGAVLIGEMNQNPRWKKAGVNILQKCINFSGALFSNIRNSTGFLRGNFHYFHYF